MTQSFCQAWAFSPFLSPVTKSQVVGSPPPPGVTPGVLGLGWGLWHLLPRVCSPFLHFLECAGELADEVVLSAGVVIIYQELKGEARRGPG